MIGCSALQSRGLMRDQPAKVVVRPGRAANLPLTSICVTHECRVPGQRRGLGKFRLETRFEVDRGHHPCEEGSNRIRARVQALRVAAAPQLRCWRSERSDDISVDEGRIEVAAEGQDLIRRCAGDRRA